MTTSSTIFASAVTSLALAPKFLIQTILRQSCIIYFRKSSSTRAPTSHEPTPSTDHSRMEEAERKAITCRTQQLRMVQQRTHNLIFLKSMQSELFNGPITWQDDGPQQPKHCSRKNDPRQSLLYPPRYYAIKVFKVLKQPISLFKISPLCILLTFLLFFIQVIAFLTPTAPSALNQEHQYRLPNDPTNRYMMSKTKIFRSDKRTTCFFRVTIKLSFFKLFKLSALLFKFKLCF